MGSAAVWVESAEASRSVQSKSNLRSLTSQHLVFKSDTSKSSSQRYVFDIFVTHDSLYAAIDGLRGVFPGARMGQYCGIILVASLRVAQVAGLEH